jgi:hypothetical protein
MTVKEFPDQKGEVVPVLNHHAMNIYGAVEVKIHEFLTSTKVSGQLHILVTLSLLWSEIWYPKYLNSDTCSMRGIN